MQKIIHNIFVIAKVSLSTGVACYEESLHLEGKKKEKNIVLQGGEVSNLAFLKGREARLPSD
jgi:hypothetical protein